MHDHVSGSLKIMAFKVFTEVISSQADVYSRNVSHSSYQHYFSTKEKAESYKESYCGSGSLYGPQELLVN